MRWQYVKRKCTGEMRCKDVRRFQHSVHPSDVKPPQIDSSHRPFSLSAGAEGKAGMAAIADPSHSSDLEKFVKDMEKALPPYARPVFLRFLPEVNKTGKILFSPPVV